MKISKTKVLQRRMTMKCPACGSELGWQNDYDLEDIGHEDKGIASHYTCRNEECESDFTHIQKERVTDSE
jgi:C4-type Zn-finger protein